jgi:hypothetical protein
MLKFCKVNLILFHVGLLYHMKLKSDIITVLKNGLLYSKLVHYIKYTSHQDL